ncbi:MAG: hypothetical protein ACRYFX_30795 [Janthinobacterium lividum]
MPAGTSLALVAADPVLRQGYHRYLCAQPEFDCGLLAGSVAEFVARLPTAARLPRLVLADLALPELANGAGLAALRRAVPAAEVVLLAEAHEAGQLVQALRAGAVGYLLKSSWLREAKASLLNVLAGGSPMSPAVARQLGRHLQAAPAVLTTQERQLVQAIGEGLSYRLVAEQLGLAPVALGAGIRQVYARLAAGAPARPGYSQG